VNDGTAFSAPTGCLAHAERGQPGFGIREFRTQAPRQTGRLGRTHKPIAVHPMQVSPWARGRRGGDWLERNLLGCGVENVQPVDVERQPYQVAHGDLEVRIDTRDHIVATHRAVQELV
jgi:hypothetical protein